MFTQFTKHRKNCPKHPFDPLSQKLVSCFFLNVRTFCLHCTHISELRSPHNGYDDNSTSAVTATPNILHLHTAVPFINGRNIVCRYETPLAGSPTKSVGNRISLVLALLKGSWYQLQKARASYRAVSVP